MIESGFSFEKVKIDNDCEGKFNIDYKSKNLSRLYNLDVV